MHCTVSGKLELSEQTNKYLLLDRPRYTALKFSISYFYILQHFAV